MSNSTELGRPADPGARWPCVPGRRTTCELTWGQMVRGLRVPCEPWPVSDPGVSVIVRTRDEAASIGRCLELVRGQAVYGEGAEVIVVDSGSRDATVEIARGFGARVVEIPARKFSFGGALNAGAAVATGEMLVALSAHAFVPDNGWLVKVVEAFGDERVACVSGDRYRPDGSPLVAPVVQDAELGRRHPEWGYSNAAGAFRAALWRERRFRADLPGCEDKEWSAYWLERGYLCLVDPALVVDHDHTHDPMWSIYARARREGEGLATGFAALGPDWALAPFGAGELARQWWSDLRFYDSPLRARLSHRRAARLVGAYVGRRRGRRVVEGAILGRNV